MLNRSLFALALVLAPLALGCGDLGLDLVTLGKDDGVPPVSGSTVIDIPQDFQCGTAISDPKGKYTVVTEGTKEECKFIFKQDVTVIKSADYSSKPELQGAQLINRIDFQVSKLGVKDPSSGKDLDPNTQLKDLRGTAFGAIILTKDDIGRAVPFTKSVEGAPVDALKSQVERKQDIIVPVAVEVLVILSPAPPKQVGLDFEAQPEVVVGF